jgi:hypothetical protein
VRNGVAARTRLGGALAQAGNPTVRTDEVGPRHSID